MGTNIKNARLQKIIIFFVGLMIILGSSSTIDISMGVVAKGIPIKITDVAFILITFYLIVFKKIKIQITNSTKILLGWTIFGVFSILLNYYTHNYKISDMIYGVLYPIRLFIYILICSVFANFLKYNEYKFDHFIDKYIKFYIIVCIIGGIQLLIFPIAFDYYNILKNMGIYILNPDPHINRLISTYLDPNFLGIILCIPFMLSLSRYMVTRKNKYIFYTIIIVITEIATSSRSGIIAIAISFVVFFISSFKVNEKKIKINKRLFLITLFIFIIITIIIIFYGDKIRVIDRIINFREDGSAQARFLNWKLSFNLISENLIIGIGYNMLGFVTGNTETIGGFGLDASLLLIWVTTGNLGLLIYISYFTNLIKRILYLRNDKNIYYSSGIIGILLGSLCASFFNNLLFYPLWFIPMLILSEFYILHYNTNKKECKNENNYRC